MTSIRREPTNRLDTLMCVCLLDLHDAPYTEVSSHCWSPNDSNARWISARLLAEALSTAKEGQSGKHPIFGYGLHPTNRFDSLYMRLCLSSLRAQAAHHLRCSTPPFQGRHPIDFKCRESYKYGSTALGPPCLSGRSQGSWSHPFQTVDPTVDPESVSRRYCSQSYRAQTNPCLRN